VGIAVSSEDRVASYIPLASPAPAPASTAGGLLFDAPDTAGDALTVTDVVETLGPALGDPGVRKVGHDLKRTMLLLSRHGVPFEGLADDALLASYVLDATRSSHAIEPLALEELGYKAATEEDVRGKGVKATAARDLSDDVQCGFVSERADVGRQLAGVLAGKVREAGLDAVYYGLELPLVPVLADMERAGIRVDGEALRGLSSRIDAELAARSARIYGLAGVEFNINSPKQLAEVLFDKLQLPVMKKTGKTRTASTAVDVLEELALSHEIPREILEWRALSKLKGTYIDALPQLMDAETGRVHTSFNQAVAATGRLSSSDPNLQNIPIRTGLGREIRGAFIADPGCCLISADYSQIELRVLAHLSGDTSLIESFRRGEDIHDRTASAVFGESPGLDPYELRRRAKIINYALLYGKTAFTLARDIGVTQQAAQAFIDAYFAGFPGVRAFIDDTLARTRQTGVVTTMLGRRRLVPEITSRNGQVRSAAERVTVNMPIQGSAADILKRAMLDVHAALAARPASGRRARMILTVHDELLFEVPIEEAEEVSALVRTHMEHAVDLAVPLTVEIGVGENWKVAKA
jgi:DNA polymerase-1